MFTFGDNILGIQGHPEYTKDILDNLIDRLLSNNSIEVKKKKNKKKKLTINFSLIKIQHANGFWIFGLQRGFGEDAKLKLMEAEPDKKYWKRICKAFLKG